MLTFEGISVKIAGKTILEDITFSLPPHKITALIGKNGSGKSTLAGCISGRVRYTGMIRDDDRSIALFPPRERAQRIAVLPQVLPPTAMTVEELVAMGRIPYLDPGSRMTDADRAQIESALSDTGLTHIAQRRVDTLSGGERQKAFLAMVLAQNTRIIVLDEPTTYMDMENAAEFLSLLQALAARHKKTVLIIMHDITKAVETADHMLVLQNGRTAFFGDTEKCVESGCIETALGVRRGTYERDGKMQPMFYR